MTVAAEHFLWLFTSLRIVIKSLRLLDHIGKLLCLSKLPGRGSGGNVNGFIELFRFQKRFGPIHHGSISSLPCAYSTSIVLLRPRRAAPRGVTSN